MKKWLGYTLLILTAISLAGATAMAQKKGEGTMECRDTWGDDRLQNRLKLKDGSRIFLFEAVEAAPESANGFEEFVGDYYSEDLDTLYHLTNPEGKLIIRHKKSGEEPLTPVYADGFSGDRGRFRFTRDEAGKVDGFTLTTGRSRFIRFDKRM